MRSLILLLLVGQPLLSLAQSEQFNSKTDSIQGKIDSLTALPPKLDSVKSKVDAGLDSIQKLNSTLSNSLALPNPDLTKFTRKLDSLKLKLTHRRDSLKAKGLPHDRYTKSIDSLGKIDPTKAWKEQQNKVAGAQSTIQGTFQKPANTVNDKLSQLSSEAGGKGTLPGAASTPELPGQNTNLDVPELKAGGITNPPVGKAAELKPDINGNAGELKKNLNIDEVGKAKEGLGDISEVTSKARGYSSDIENIGTGNLSEVKEMPGDIQSKIPLEGTEQLQQGNQTLDKMGAQAKSFKNPEAFRKQTMERGKQEVIKQLSTQNPSFENSVGKVSQYQKRGTTLFNRVKGLPEKKTKKQPLPVIERFVPGLTFQVQKKNYLLIDINSSIRYRFNTIFSLGAGWLDRIGFDDGKYRNDLRVYGVRTFGEVALIKGFSLRLDAERTNAFVPVSLLQQDQGERKWVNYYLGGLKKEFSFFPGVQGNVQFMYNLSHKDGTSPYATRFNVRFGFEFPLKEE